MNPKKVKILTIAIIITMIAIIGVGGYMIYDIKHKEKLAQSELVQSQNKFTKIYDEYTKNANNKKDFDKNSESNEKSSYDAVIKNLTSDDILDATKNSSALQKQVVGKIVAKSINMNIPLFEGFNTQKLATGAGTLKANQSVTKNGNFAVAGHNMNTSHPILFSQVEYLKKDAKLTVEYKGTKGVYYVTGVYKIKPTDYHNVLDEDAIKKKEKWLTLITCTEDSKNRYMIRAIQK